MNVRTSVSLLIWWQWDEYECMRQKKQKGSDNDVIVAQSRDLDRLNNQWCQDSWCDEWQISDHCCCYGEAVDATTLLCSIGTSVMWKKDDILSYGISQLYRWGVASEVRWATVGPWRQRQRGEEGTTKREGKHAGRPITIPLTSDSEGLLC